MVLKLFRAAWFLSVLVVLVNLLHVYASLPEVVTIQGGDDGAMGRETFFYVALGIVVGINTLVYFFKWFFAGRGEEIRAWFHGLLITFNIFIIIALQVLNVHNGHEVFDRSLLGIYLTGSLCLILLWALAWPVYLLAQRFLSKQTV